MLRVGRVSKNAQTRRGIDASVGEGCDDALQAAIAALRDPRKTGPGKVLQRNPKLAGQRHAVKENIHIDTEDYWGYNKLQWRSFSIPPKTRKTSANTEFLWRGRDFVAVASIEDDRFDYNETRIRAYGFIDGVAHALVFTFRGQAIRVISLRRAREKEMRRYAPQD